jgi:hypothetical protein
METDHIVPEAEGGDDSIENAIPVCFECHAEIHSYNDKHPRGRKYLPEELRSHKEQWLKLCQERPDILVSASRVSDVGPLQALIDELELNATIASRPAADDQGCLFHDEQFRRAIQVGSVAILRDEIRKAVLDAYVAIGRANPLIDAASRHFRTSLWSEPVNEARKRIAEAQPKIAMAQEELLRFVATEPPIT